MRDALSILDMCLGYGEKVDEELVRRVLGTSGRDFLFRFAEALIEEDAAAVFGLIDELMMEGREPAVFAREMARHLRTLLMAHYCPDELADLMDLTREDAQSYIGQAANVSDTRLMSMIDLMMSVEPKLRLSSSPRVALETAALHACLRTGETDTAALQDRIVMLEKQLAALREQLQSGSLAPAAPADPEVSGAAPAASPAPPPKQASIAKDQQQIWKEAMQAMARKNPGLFSLLSSGGKLAEAVDDCFVWAPRDTSFSFSLDTVNKPENREIVEDALSTAAGRACHFMVQVPEPEKKTASGERETLRTLRDTFGADSVMVQEE
jgi:DNA polymerase-3 subunit gamma/tau